MEQLKLVTVGDGAVGKTCLLIRYAKGEYPEEYIPTVFDDYAKETQVNETETVMFGLWDTAGGEDYPRLRPLSYPQTDVFLLCFDIEYSSSFENIESTWIPELNHHCPDVPVILVGTKSDLREDMKVKERLDKKGQKFKTFDEGVVLAEKIKAVAYLECSALSGEGVKEVFDKALEVGYDHLKLQMKKKGHCHLL